MRPEVAAIRRRRPTAQTHLLPPACSGGCGRDAELLGRPVGVYGQGSVEKPYCTPCAGDASGEVSAKWASAGVRWEQRPWVD